MTTVSNKSDQLTNICIKAICNDINVWANELFIYLKKYGISKKKCRQIARRRAMYAIECLENGKIVNVFYKIEGTEAAVAIYNSYIRHWKTNYDIFCEEVNSVIYEKPPLFNGIEIKKLWKQQHPEQFEKYEKNCIFIDERLKRVFEGHFTY